MYCKAFTLSSETSSGNISSMYYQKMLVFPTPESPTKTILNLFSFVQVKIVSFCTPFGIGSYDMIQMKDTPFSPKKY